MPSRFAATIGTVVIGGLLTVFTGGAAAGTFAAALNTAGVGLIVSGGLGLLAGLVTQTGDQGLSGSPTYANASLGNLRGEGGVIPYVYGEMRYPPLEVSAILDSGDDADEVERVYLLGFAPMQVHSTTLLPVDVASGRIALADRLVSDLPGRITLNDIPLQEIDPSASARIVETTASVKSVPGFNRRGRPNPQSGTHLQRQIEHRYVMKESSEAVHMVFDWPRGLLKVESGGDTRESAGGVVFKYRKAGTDGEFLTMDLGAEVTFGKKWNGTEVASFEASKDNPDWVPAVPSENIRNFVAGRYFVADKTRGHVRKVAKFTFPKPGRYEILLVGVVDDDLNDVRAPIISNIIEVDFADVTTLEGITLLGVKYKANDQMRGTEATLKIKALGRKVKQYEDAALTPPVGWTNNGISCLADYVTHVDGALGMWIAELDLDASGLSSSWRTHAQGIALETYSVVPEKGGKAITGTHGTCNMIVDTEAATRDWVNHFLMLFDGTIYDSEGLLKLTRERSITSVRTFTERSGLDPLSTRYNILASGNRTSLSLTAVDASDRYNRVVIAYLDESVGYERRHAIEPPYQDEDGDALEPGILVPERLLEIYAPGITCAGQALSKARYLVDKAQNSAEIGQWQFAWGDLDIEPGARVTVQADWPNWDGDEQDFWVLSLEYGGDGIGTIVGRRYPGEIFGEAPQTKPPTPDAPAPGSGDFTFSAPAATTVDPSVAGPAGIAGPNSPSNLKPTNTIVTGVFATILRVIEIFGGKK